jgi:predicted dehydrogenase
VSAEVRVGVVGTGAMGRHHVRILGGMAGAQLVGLYDLRGGVAEQLASEHGSRAFGTFDELIEAADALVIAAPTVDHADLACRALAAGLHVLVEKPMAVDLAEADRMIAAAGKAKLAVGHVEFFNPAVQRLLALNTGPRFIEVERISRFTPRSLDVDVILDLMIHDLQIVHALDPSDLVEVRALGIDVLSPRVDIASARLELASGCVVNLTASRVSEEPKRHLRVFFGDSYYSLDYKDQSIKGFRLDAAIREGRAPMSPEAILPAEVEVERGEPLVGEIESFVRVCRGEDVSWVDAISARRALETALLVRREVERRRESFRQEAGRGA